MSPPSRCRPSSVLCCATRGGGFICGGVSSDSPPCRLPWQLHRLLVGHSGPSQVWLSDRQHCLGHARHCCGWCWHSLGQSAWVGHPRNPLYCAPQSSTPPNPREVRWGCGSSSCWGLRRWQPPFRVVYGREAWWGVVGTRSSLLQPYQEWSCLLRRQSLHTLVTLLLPGSMMEGRLPSRYTWSPSGSRSGSTPTRLPSRAGRVELRPQDSLRCPGWAVVPSVQR